VTAARRTSSGERCGPPLQLRRAPGERTSTSRYPPRLAGPALSVSSGAGGFVSQMQEESDLMLVENFR
jgi:hypothetical protein